jgi:hypothetical protein
LSVGVKSKRGQLKLSFKYFFTFLKIAAIKDPLEARPITRYLWVSTATTPLTPGANPTITAFTTAALA